MRTTSATASPPVSTDPGSPSIITGPRVTKRFWPGAAAVIAVLAAWEVASRVGAIPTDVLPSMTATLRELMMQLSSSSFWAHVARTMSNWAIGLLAAVVIGLMLGLLLGSFRAAERSSATLIEFLKPVPPVALIPLALLLWGPSRQMATTLVCYGAVWPVLIQVMYGVQSLDPVVEDVAHAYQVRRRDRIFSVLVPTILPFLATGVRIAASIALIVAIVVELVGGVDGIGRGIVLSQSAGDLPRMYADIVFVGVLGVLINAAFSAAERPILRWHPSHRKVAS